MWRQAIKLFVLSQQTSLKWFDKTSRDHVIHTESDLWLVSYPVASVVIDANPHQLNWYIHPPSN